MSLLDSASEYKASQHANCGRTKTSPPLTRSSARSRHTHASAEKLLALSASTISRLASWSPGLEDHATGHQIVDFGPGQPLLRAVRHQSESLSALRRNRCPPSVGIRTRHRF